LADQLGAYVKVHDTSFAVKATIGCCVRFHQMRAHLIRHRLMTLRGEYGVAFARMGKTARGPTLPVVSRILPLVLRRTHILAVNKLSRNVRQTDDPHSARYLPQPIKAQFQRLKYDKKSVIGLSIKRFAFAVI
jgi:hypothetical protein